MHDKSCGGSGGCKGFPVLHSVQPVTERTKTALKEFSMYVIHPAWNFS